MLRRVLSTVLIFPLLGSQLPAMPHSHAGTGISEPNDHAARPHVHLHGHGHHHHGDGHSHHHHAPVANSKPVKVKRTPITAVNAVGEHGDDAVYLPEGSTYSPTSKSLSWKPVSQITATLDLHIAVTESTTSQSEAMFSRPPPGSTWSTPLYLRTLSLRI